MVKSEVCRRHGISWAAFDKWKAKYGGLDVSDARKLKTLETENARPFALSMMGLSGIVCLGP